MIDWQLIVDVLIVVAAAVLAAVVLTAYSFWLWRMGGSTDDDE